MPATLAACALLASLCTALLPATAQAQAFDAVRLFGAAPGKDGGNVGAALIHGRKYAGSDERRTMLLPGLDYQWANGWFAGTSNGVGFNFSGRPDLAYGLRLTADMGREESRSRFLRGLGDIDPAAELGGFFNWAPSREFGLTSSLRYGSGSERKGLLLDLGASFSIEVQPGLRLGLGLAGTLANDSALQSAFGVTPAQARASGLRAYTPSAGLRDVRASVSVLHRINPRTGVLLAVSAGSLQDDAADSPITRQASSTSAVLAVTWSF